MCVLGVCEHGLCVYVCALLCTCKPVLCGCVCKHTLGGCEHMLGACGACPGPHRRVPSECARRQFPLLWLPCRRGELIGDTLLT